MDLEVLKKKISTFKGEGGRVRITSDELLLEILSAWEQWPGPIKSFYSGIGVSSKGMASIIGKAKKLKREGHFAAEDFKPIQLVGARTAGGSDSPARPCLGIELVWDGGRVIRFAELEQLTAFLKMVA